MRKIYLQPHEKGIALFLIPSTPLMLPPSGDTNHYLSSGALIHGSSSVLDLAHHLSHFPLVLLT